MNKESIHESVPMKKEYVYSNIMYIFIIFYNFLSIFYMYSSEIIPPNIEVIAPVIQSTIIEFSSIKDTPEESTIVCTHAIFEAVIKKKYFSTIIEYSPEKKDFILYLSLALEAFKKTILADEIPYFKECPQLKEILFPQRTVSPLKNLNANHSPRSSSPVHNRRSSGSLPPSSFFQKFSKDPDIEEMPKDIVLKTPAHKSRALFIIAHCMLTAQPDILETAYDNLKTEAYKKVKELSNKLEENKKLTLETKKSELTDAAALEQKYSALQNDKNSLEKTIENYKTTIQTLETELAQVKKILSTSDATESSEDATQETVIQNLKNEIDRLQQKISEQTSLIEKYKKSSDSTMENCNTARNEIKAYEKTVSLYKIGTGMCVACNIFFLIMLLYQNKLLPHYIQN